MCYSVGKFASFKQFMNWFVWNSSLKGHHYNTLYTFQGSIDTMHIILSHKLLLPINDHHLHVDGLVYGVWRHFQQYFSYIVAVSFIGGGHQSTWRKSPTCHKSLTKFITLRCIKYTSPWTGFELATSLVIGTDCIGSRPWRHLKVLLIQCT